MGRSILLAAAIFISAISTGAGEPPLDPAVRAAIDRQALEADPGGPVAAGAGLASDLVITLLARLPVASEAIAAAVDAELGRLRALYKPVPDGGAEQAILGRLTAALPGAVREARTWKLVVLEAGPPACAGLGEGTIVCSSAALPAWGEGLFAARLAREMGHLALGHAERCWQAEIAARLIAEPARREDLRARLRAGGRAGLALAGFVHDPADRHQADRFALQLCSRAGFDPEHLLDDLRREARQEIPARRRLRALLMQRRGLVDRPEAYGLFSFAGGELHRVEDGAWAGRRPIVATHGLEGGLKSCKDLLARLAGDPRLAGRPLAFFAWPNDAGIEQAGRFLGREMARAGAGPGEACLVAHSAGGLVVRWWVQCEGGRPRALVCAGSPHGGSDLARLASFLELGELLGRLWPQTGAPLIDFLADGQGDLGVDLRPDSLALAQLGAAPGISSPQLAVRGQVLKPAAAIALEAALIASRHGMAKRIERSVADAGLREILRNGLDRLRVPEEILRGDLAVAIDRAVPQGDVTILTVDRSHLQLLRDPEVLAAITAWLAER